MIKWKDIPGFEGKYMVSSEGEIKSYDHKKWNGKTFYLSRGRILKPIDNGSGYLSVSLGSVKYRDYIHRIVAKSFLPNPDHKPQVNHINGIKTDNRIENLQWVTGKENMRHSFDNGLHKTTRLYGTDNGRYKHGKRCLYKSELSISNFGGNG